MRRNVVCCLAAFVLMTVIATSAYAVSTYLTSVVDKYGATYAGRCDVCHLGGPPALNSYGNAFSPLPHGTATQRTTALTSLEPQDSDGDGFTNLAEFQAGTFPGDPNSKPAPPVDSTAPTVTSFTIPAASSSLTIPIQSFAANDAVGVTGYMVTESSVAPAAADTRWNATAPTSFVASAPGPVTLFAWAKDATGNVSAPLSSTVTITLPPTGDTQAPTVPGGLTASATSGAISLTWTASVDDVGVSGYLIFRNGVQFAATVTSTNFIDTAVAASTTYAYTVRATDAAGNISADSNSVTVTTLAAGGNSIPLPTGGQVFSSLPVDAPVLSLDPGQVLPMGLGAYANGGDTVAIVIGLAAFSGPADIYLGLSAPTLSPELFLLNSSGFFQPLSAGVVRWKSNMQPAPLNVTLLPELPMASVPPGRYTLFLVVTPAGSTSGFYLWDTAFTVDVPWQTSLSGAEMVPPVATTGTGVANFAVDPATGGLAGTLVFSGLSSAATQAHIHQGAAGTNGDVIVTLAGGAGSTSGVWTVPPGAALTPGQLTALQSGGLYFVVHSATNPTGEIRGQITYPVVSIEETLSGAEAVPPVTTTGSATASLTVNIDTGEISGIMRFSNLSGNATGGHIHLGSHGSPGPIVVDFEGGDGARTGTYRVPVGATLTNEQLANLASNNTYLVIHSLTNPNGEIAGQITYPAGAPRP